MRRVKPRNLPGGPFVVIREKGMVSITIPALRCGVEGFAWETVMPMNAKIPLELDNGADSVYRQVGR